MAGEVGQADFIRDSSGEVVGIRNGAQEFYGLATLGELAAVQALVSGGGGVQPLFFTTPARVVTCGNSINSDPAWTTGYHPSGWKVRDELGHAMQRAPGKLQRRKFVDSTTVGNNVGNGTGRTAYASVGNCDMYGTWGHGGATLSTILPQLASSSPNVQWLPLMTAANYRPDLVIGMSLLENDIGQDRTVAQMQADVQRFIAIVRGWWPGMPIILLTPRPSLSFSTAARQAAFAGIRDWLMTQYETGVTGVWAINISSAYENPTAPARPRYDTMQASLASTTLTVTTAPATPIGLYHYIVLPSDPTKYVQVTAYGTGTGGVGTYTVTVSGGLTAASPTDLILCTHTDPSVHPNSLGTISTSNVIAAWMQSNVRVASDAATLIGSNTQLVGTAAANYAASGPQSGSLGTLPTGVSHGSACGADLRFTATADQPGFTLNISTAAALTAAQDLGSIALWSTTPAAGVKRAKLVAEVEVVSGGQYLRALYTSARQFAPDALNPSAASITPQSTESPVAMGNGVFRLESGEVVSGSAPVTNDIGVINGALRVFVEAGTPSGASIVIRVRSAGYVNLT